jgi:hypothetical protein
VRPSETPSGEAGSPRDRPIFARKEAELQPNYQHIGSVKILRDCPISVDVICKRHGVGPSKLAVKTLHESMGVALRAGVFLYKHAAK